MSTINIDTAPPLRLRKALLTHGDISVLLNVASIVFSSVNMDTQAEASDTAFDADIAGLLYFRYLTTFIIAIVSVVKVYAAIAIVVIS